MAFEMTFATDNKNTSGLSNQGTVPGDVPGAPPVDAGKQGKHVPGHPNYRDGGTSWPEGQTGVNETQEAWQRGEDRGENKKQYDFGRPVGPDGETSVRAHQDSKGNIHGHPVP